MIGTWYDTAKRSGSCEANSVRWSVKARLIGFQSPLTRPKARNALDLRVQDLGPHAVAVHGGQPRHRIAVAGVAERLDVPVLHRQLLPAAEVILDLGLRTDGVVERLVQSLREAGADDVEVDRHVRVGRDQLGHRPSRVLRRTKHSIYYDSL